MQDGKNILLLFDSGATKSILSASVVKASRYLSSLKPNKVKPTYFRLGNGQFLLAKETLTLDVNIQGHRIEISAYVTSNLTGIDLVLGTDTMKRLKGVLDFSDNSFVIKSKVLRFHPTNKVVIFPGQTKYVNIQSRVPSYARNAEVILNPATFIAHMCPASMIVKLRKGRTRILLSNKSTRPFIVLPKHNLASFDLSELATVLHEIPSCAFDEWQHERQDSLPNNGHVNTAQISQSDASELLDREYIRSQNLQRHPHLNSDDPLASLTESEIIRKYVSLEQSVLSPQEREKFYQMLENNNSVFSLYGELSSCPNFEADITLTNTDPFFIRPYKLSPEDKIIVSKELDKLVSLGILAVGHQSYTSPVFLIPKKGTNEKRVVTDFRFLNSRIQRINHPFPLLNETLRTIGNSDATVLSVLDLKSAFFCIPLSKNAQRYTGIASYSGGKHYYYKRLPQGLNLSPAIFQAKMNEVLSQVPNSDQFCISMHDDIIVYSKDKTSHFKHLAAIFEALIANGLKISPRKCCLFRTSVLYMGHILTVNGDGTATIKPLTDRCAAIRNTPVPHNVKAARRFVGAVNYISQFFPHVQKHLRPIHKLSRQRKQFKWTDECQQAFDTIRELMCNPPILHMPKRKGRLTLYSDTSRVATGSYLTQTIDGKEYLLGYYSKVLPDACSRYSVTELELFGLLININGFLHLLKDVEFDAFVDHAALVEILSSKHEPPTTRMRNLLFKLSQFSFKIGYKKGSELALADYLSRAPQQGDSEIDRILPLAFSAISDSILDDSDNYVNPVLTRAKAKALGIRVPDLYPSKKAASTTETTTAREVQPPAMPKSKGSSQQRNVARVPPPRGEILLPPPPPAPVPLAQPLPRPVQPIPMLHQRPVISQVKPVTISEPRLVDLPPPEERYRDPPDDIAKPNKPLISDVKNIRTTHIPHQKDIQRVMKKIQSKIVRDYNLPFDAKELRMQQATCPFFKPIFDFLAHDILPQDAKTARSIRNRAEEYILCDGLLFRLTLHKKHKSRVVLQLVIPDTMIEKILCKYHDDLLSCHQGVMRTYLTIRQHFFMRNMFQVVSNYVKACLRCQEFKPKRDKVRQFHPRVPDSYRPFDRISLDFKTMPTSNTGYKHLMVACDQITRFLVCVPLQTLDAETICEAILQKIITIFGPPTMLITDAAKSLTGKLVELLCSSLNIDKKVISVCNHGSLQVERHIQTLSNFLKVNLGQFGSDWVRFIPTTTYAYNAFSSPHLGDHSPFELVYGRKPPDLTNLTFNPMEGLSHSYSEYVALLNKRFQHLSQTMLNLQKKQQDKQNVKINSKLDKGPIYSVGQLVYLYKPTSSSLTANSRKIVAEWVGPLVIHEILDRTHYLLQTLQGDVLQDVFNYNRLKPCFVRASKENKLITDVNKLKDVYNDSVNVHMTDELTNNEQFHDETGNHLPPVTCSEVSILYRVEPVDISLCSKFAKSNRNLAATTQLQERQITLQFKQLARASNSSMTVCRARFHMGHLQILLCMAFSQSDKKPMHAHRFWWQPSLYSNTSDILEILLDSRIPITGSPERFSRRLFGAA